MEETEFKVFPVLKHYLEYYRSGDISPCFNVARAGDRNGPKTH